MKWARAIWVAVTYTIAIIILLDLFSTFNQPFETAVIALIGLVYVAIKEESAIYGSVLSGQMFAMAQEFLSVKRLVAAASDEGKQGGFESAFKDQVQEIQKRQYAAQLSPGRIVVTIGLSLMALVCLYNLVWALNQ